MTPFVNLHNHTHFSLLNSLVSPEDLFRRAKELDQKAIGITDYGTLTAAWDCLKISKDTGIKLIIGCEFYFLNSLEEKNSKFRYVVLLAKNAVGYKNLLALTKLGFENSFSVSKRPFPVLTWDLLEKYNDGLICLTACGNGIISQLLNVKKFDQAEEALKKLITIYGENLGIEVQTNYLSRPANNYSEAINQIFTNTHLIRLASKYNVRIVPTNNTLYLKKEDAKTHDIMLAIGAMQPVYSNARTKYNVSDMYLKSGDEVKAFFARTTSDEFAQKMCENTLYFADLCEDPKWIDPMYGVSEKKELPIFPIEQDKYYNDYKIWIEKQPYDVKKLNSDQSYLRFRCEMALFNKIPLGKDKEYRDRLELELDTIYYCDVSGYLLIIADLVNWARQNDIFVGPGRGSCGGSLITYLLGIHKADPIKYGLVFERFHNKLKPTLADIDMDFSKAQREKVLQYLIDKYGQDNFAHITNIIYITPKVYARDICRACELGPDRKLSVKLGNNIADFIPKKSPSGKDVRSYKDIIENSAMFNEYFLKKYPELGQYSAICEKPRALGIHASGILISKRPLHNIVPLRIDKERITSVQFDKDRAEDAGLVKIDVLGLETLDIIEQTNELIKKAKKELPVIDYDKYDKKTYDLITRGDTFGVFQFGTSAGTIDLCKKIKPKSIEDLAIITAIARPVSKNIRADFIKAREGKLVKKLLHPSLNNALQHTFGFLVYDESLLIIAKDVAGWDLAEADKLRKLTKEKGKNPEKAERWRQEFIEGAVKNNVERVMAIKIWDDIISPAGSYAFNKSHAIPYSMISYHTAYLKAHFPIEFLLANLIFEVRSSSDKAASNKDKIKNELKNHGIKVLPPDINKSDMTFKLLEDNSLLTGFEALKYVSQDAIEEIIQQRPFKSFDDLMKRCSPQKVKVNTIKALAASGCLDIFNLPRRTMFLYCQDYKKKLQALSRKKNLGVFEYPWPVESEWILSELYALEKFYLDSSFICNKVDAYGDFFKQKSILIKDIYNMENKKIIPSIRVEVKDVFTFFVKKQGKFLGKEMVKATVEDELGDQISLTIFPDRWKDIQDRMRIGRQQIKFESGIAIHFSGSANLYEDEMGIILNEFFDYRLSPPMPKDLKTKKTSITRPANENELNKVDLNDIDNTIANIEDQLVFEGLIDLDKDELEEFDFPIYK